jgi:hypothetical protein
MIKTVTSRNDVSWWLYSLLITLIKRERKPHGMGADLGMRKENMSMIPFPQGTFRDQSVTRRKIDRVMDWWLKAGVAVALGNLALRANP